jgi:hypothetical protein
MGPNQPPSDQPDEPQRGEGAGLSSGSPLSREQMREMARARAAELPGDALPAAPISPEAVRELAADLATELLLQMAQQSEESPEDEVQGFAFSTRFQCTGASFACTGTGYTCATSSTHSCKDFACNHFACTSAFSGLTRFTAMGFGR